MSWNAHIITGFPTMFPGTLGESLAGRAREDGLWSLTTHDVRAHGQGKHKNIDDTPAGGGAGMVMRADVAASALDSVTAQHNLPVLLPSPRGVPWTQDLAQELAEGAGAIFFCNRYEGIDERFIEARAPLEVSLGDYILSGGEPAALVMLDSIIRLLPGVMGKVESGLQESFSSQSGGLLEHPQYTRPQVWEGMEVPEVVISGDHEKIAKWRHQRALEITQERRPDLLEDLPQNDSKSKK